MNASKSKAEQHVDRPEASKTEEQDIDMKLNMNEGQNLEVKSNENNVEDLEMKENIAYCPVKKIAALPPEDSITLCY